MRAIFMTALLFALSPLVVADPPGESTPRFWADINAEASARIEAVLNSPLSKPGLEFVETPLVEVVAFLREEYELPIVLDRRALEDLSVRPEEPIIINLRDRNISLGAALRLMLKDLDMTYVIVNEVLLITSVEVAATRLRTAVYPVGDLMKSMDIEQLIDTVVNCLPPSYDCGSRPGDIVPLAGRHLVVTADHNIHESVAFTLKAIREAEEFANSGDGSSDASLEHDADAEIGHAETVHEHSHEEAHSEAEHEHEAHEADVNPFGEVESDDNPFGF